MPTIQIGVTITCEGNSGGTKTCGPGVTQGIGVRAKGNVCRSATGFPLTDLPSDASVTQVRVRVYCSTVGGAAHLADIHPYGGNGQPNPETDDGATFYSNCAAGVEYVDDTIELRSVGTKWFDLGSQACSDVQAAKQAVNRFSLGWHEEGDNDSATVLDHTVQMYLLEITYTVPTLAGYSYSDGLVSVQVAG